MAAEGAAVKFRGTMALAATALLFGAAFFGFILPRAKEARRAAVLAGQVFRFDAATVEFLRIRNGNGFFDLAREGSRWSLTAPRALPADAIAVERLLGAVRNGKIEKVITDDLSRLAEFGLSEPRFVLAIGYQGRIDELAIGVSNPARTAYYAYAKGVSAIFLVDPSIAEALALSLFDLRSKEVFSFDPEAVTRLSILRGSSHIELRKSAEGWGMLRPISGRASEEAVRRFLSGISDQRALELYDDRVPRTEDYRETIILSLLEHGRDVPVRISVHYWGTGANEGVVAFQNGMQYAGRLPRELWNLMTVDASWFRYRSLFAFDEADVAAVRVKLEAGEYQLARHGDSWRIADQTVEGKKVLELLWFLKSWAAEALLPAGTPVRRDAFTAEISLADRKGRSLGSVTVYGKAAAATGFSLEGGAVDQYYASSTNLPQPATVSSIDLKNIPSREDLRR